MGPLPSKLTREAWEKKKKKHLSAATLLPPGHKNKTDQQKLNLSPKPETL